MASLEEYSPRGSIDSQCDSGQRGLEASLAKLIGGKPIEIARATGASTGMTALSHLLDWSPGDEVITTKGEFPLQYATWKPMEEREGIALKIVTARGHFITAVQLIDARPPRTPRVAVTR